MIYFLSMPKKYAILHHWGSSVHQSVAKFFNFRKQRLSYLIYI